MPVYKLHDTRSTFATILWSRGTVVSAIQAMLGHADVRTTMGYIVSYQEQGDEGAQIEQAFSEAMVPTVDRPSPATGRSTGQSAGDAIR